MNYTFKHPTSDEFIAVVHGETGYHATTVYTQDHADELNRMQGHSAEQVDAAMTCSMFGTWDKFPAALDNETGEEND
ncbi:MAG: hypothetical protein QGI31_09900 [Dehalococcoidia bacterium]|nr:hypothetical protein [Dehalococcoidia bacterium]